MSPSDEQEYQALPQYVTPQPGPRMATAKEQAPLMKMIGKMISPKTHKMPRMKGKISPQSVKLGHKKKQQQTIYY